jgi:hypothetical protein
MNATARWRFSGVQTLNAGSFWSVLSPPDSRELRPATANMDLSDISLRRALARAALARCHRSSVYAGRFPTRSDIFSPFSQLSTSQKVLNSGRALHQFCSSSSRILNQINPILGVNQTWVSLLRKVKLVSAKAHHLRGAHAMFGCAFLPAVVSHRTSLSRCQPSSIGSPVLPRCCGFTPGCEAACL